MGTGNRVGGEGARAREMLHSQQDPGVFEVRGRNTGSNSGSALVLPGLAPGLALVASEFTGRPDDCTTCSFSGFMLAAAGARTATR